MKKVLIITYYWPPAGGAGVQRWLKFAKYLPEYGWEPIIYTPENPESPALDHSLLKDIPSSVSVIKTPIWEPFDWYKKFTGRKKTETLGAGFLSESSSSGLSEKIAVWVRGNFFIPDAKCFWIKPSVIFLMKYLLENPVDLIVSTGPPHTTHMIALKLIKKLNIKWIADFRDPWTEIDFFDQLRLTDWAKRKHFKLERLVIENADQVITVGKSMSKSFENQFAVAPVTITNGYDEDDLLHEEVPSGDRFTLVHVGSINKDRNHRVFWESIRELVDENSGFKSHFELHFIGKTDLEVKNDVEKYELQDQVKFTPYLDHDQVLRQEKAASVLYLPINNTSNSKGILTGKVFEYLAAHRPILAIAPPDGDLAAILNESGAGRVSDFDDKKGFKSNLRDLFEQFQQGKLKLNSKGIEKYSRKNLTKQLVDEMNQLIT